MNERIKELSGKALDKAVPYTWTKLDYEQIQELLACHAELIVRECMSQIEEVRQIKAGNAEPVYTQGFEDGMFVAIRTIEEHFGVEE